MNKTGKEGEAILYPKTLASCACCGENICDGDTAYFLMEFYLCPACVENARIIARPHSTLPWHYLKRDGKLVNFPAGIPRRGRKPTINPEI